MRETKQKARSFSRKNIALWVLAVLLCSAVAVQGQPFFGCRSGNQWAETPMLRKSLVLSNEHWHPNHDSVFFFLDVASLGYHEVYVNGTRVGNEVMQPAVSQLNKRAMLVRYSIGDYLHVGTNEIMLWLGQGWGRVYGTPAAATAKLYRVVSDGDRALEYLVCQTDSSWEASPSGYSYTGNWQPLQFGGERFDARVRPLWGPATRFASDSIRIARQEFQGNHIVDTLVPQSLKLLDSSTILVDFGRVCTGWFQCEFPALASGTEVQMDYLDDLHGSYVESDVYWARGNGKELFTNRFHLHAFRYVRIRTEMASRLLRSVKVRALPVSAVNPKGGATFECSDERFNAIHDMIKYTLSNLTHSGYMVDCPHLERMGYGGDGNASTPTLQTLWGVGDTYRNWLSAWADAIEPDGELPYVAPAFRTGGGPYWSSFVVKAPWQSYLHYDDLLVVRQMYPVMKQWMHFILEHSKDYILQPWPDNDRHTWFLGDWLAPAGVDIGGESVLHVSSCVVSECLDLMSKMATGLDKNDEAHQYRVLRDSVNRAIHRHFYHPESHTYANGTSLDQAYALLLGVPPDSATAADVKARLLSNSYYKYNAHIAVGLVGVPVFTEWCVRERQTDLMATILRQTDCPGYLYMIRNGATTTWESWGCPRPDAPANDDLVRSHVHNCYNGIGIWFYQALAGIRPDPDHPGYKHFFIDPQPCNGISWLRASQPTAFGDIVVEINGKILKVIVPPSTTATVFPNTSRQRLLQPGEWVLSR